MSVQPGASTLTHISVGSRSRHRPPGLPYLLSLPYLPIGVSVPRKGWKLSECAYIGTNLTVNLVSMLHSGEMVGLLAQLPSWRPRRFGGADELEGRWTDRRVWTPFCSLMKRLTPQGVSMGSVVAHDSERSSFAVTIGKVSLEMTTKHVDFEQPPIIEVVCGVSFTPLEKFTVAHLGRFWNKLGPRFKNVAEVPTLPAMSEQFDQPASVSMQLFPPLATNMPRVWFISESEDHLVQVQRDRFLCNWRKLNDAHKYPSYDVVIDQFWEQLRVFEEFATEDVGMPVEYTQYELTYINHVAAGAGWASLADVGDVLPDYSWRRDGARFLPTPETVDWSSSFALPEKKGRLHLRVRSAERIDSGQHVLMVELTARGFEESRTAWFDLAHEWIVKAFTDLTAQEIQKSVWGRTK